MNIVIADDDPVQRKYLRLLLAHAGHAAIEREDGVATIEYLEQHSCDAVISDILMPRMDGFRLCYEIRRHKELANLPVILYTATYLSAADEQAALAMGADRYLRKPTVPEVIVSTLHEVIESARRRHTKAPIKPARSSALREYSEVLVRKLEQINLELANTNEALRESEERQRFAASAGHIGIWEWDTTTDHLIWSAEQKIIFGWPGDRSTVTLQDFMNATHPDDRERLREAFETAMVDRIDYEAEYRVIWPDGSVHWVAGKGHGDYDETGRCTRMIGISLDITRRKEAEAARQRNLDRMRALHEIGLTINSSLNLEKILDALLAKIETFLPFSSATTVRLVNKQSGKLDTLACRNLDPAIWQSSVTATPGGRARQVLENKTPVMVRDVATDPATHDLETYRRSGIVSYIAVPLIVEGGAIGLLNLYTREDHPFADEEIEFLLILSGQAAIAIHNAQLYQDNEQRRRVAEELARIGRLLTETLNIRAIGERVVNSVLPLFEVQGATLRLRQSDGSLTRFAVAGEVFARSQSGVVLPQGIGLASRAFNLGKPVWSADILSELDIRLSDEMREQIRQSGNGSMITVPLRAQENVLGTLTLSDRTGRSYSDNEVALLQTFAVQVALALRNAQLYEQTQNQLKRIEALREIETATRSTLDLRSVLQLLLEKIENFLPFPVATTIRLFNHATGKFDNIACRNLDEQEWRARIGRGTGNLSRQVLQTRRPVIVADIQKDSDRSASPFYRQYGFVSYLGIPLIAKNEVLGILGFYTRTAHDFCEDETDFLMTLADQAAIAIQNAQLYDGITAAKNELEATNRSLDRSLRQLDGLYTALSPIATSESAEELMNGITARLMDATGADAALIRLRDSQTGRLPIVAHRGFPPEYLTRLKDAPAEGGVSWVIQHGEPIIAPDITTESRLRGKTQLELGLRSCAMLPIGVRGEARGILHIASRVPGRFDSEQKNHLMAIARQMSNALENRDLFDEVKASRDELARANEALSESNRKLSALHAVAAAASQSINLKGVLDRAIEKITDILDFDIARIHLYEEHTEEITLRATCDQDPERLEAGKPCKIGEGVIGTVVRTGEPLVFENVDSDPGYQRLTRSRLAARFNRRFLAVFPIRSKLQVLGALSCIGSEPRRLTDGETQLLEALADQLAVAIENSKLYQALNAKIGELQSKTLELEQANKVKDDFLSVVSHELRTPINVIMGYTTLLADNALGEIHAAQADALEKISRQANELLTMINSILYATSLESEPSLIDLQEFSLSRLLMELRANCSVQMRGPVSIVWHYPTELPPLTSDRRKLRQILDNLIDNSVKFTDSGRIQISARVLGCGATDNTNSAPDSTEAGNAVEIAVSDTGIGIPPDAMSRIFDKFYQVDSSQTRRHGGVGLGLYIAKKFTELLGGTIEAQSVYGQGSTFTLRLPLERLS